MDYYSLMGPLVRMLPAEAAHKAALDALKCGLVPPSAPFLHPALQTSVFGLSFPNPVGLSAGIDNNAEAVDAFLSQGFGFVEMGGVTPLPQPGNPRPRLFRLPEDGAAINRMGLSNQGVQAFARNVARRKTPGIVGANIARNKDSLDHTYDYLACLEAVYPHVDYITLNISSPNTVGLRDLQQKETLSALMEVMGKRRDELAQASGRRRPVFYKIAPDLTEQEKADIVETALAHRADGLVVANTTVSRPETLQSRHGQEKGGLSGKPLFALATQTLRDVYRLSQGKIPLIGNGGIASAQDAYEKIRAGASLVQLYTALIYQGFGLVRRINEGLVERLERDGFKNLTDAIGTE